MAGKSARGASLYSSKGAEGGGRRGAIAEGLRADDLGEREEGRAGDGGGEGRGADGPRGVAFETAPNVGLRCYYCYAHA